MFQNINSEYYEEEIENKKDKKYVLNNFLKLQNIILYIITLAISSVEIGDSKISPFGLAIFAACCGNKLPAGPVFVFAAIGTYFGFGNSGILTYLLTALVFIMFSLIYKPKYENTVRNEKKKLGVHVVFASFMIQIIGIAFRTFYVYDLITSILFTILVYIFYKIFTNSITVIKDYGEKKAFTVEEVIGASLLVSVAISSVGNFSIVGFSIRNILSILIVLVLGWKNGILVGTTGGVTIGVVLGIIGQGEPALIGAFALSRNDGRSFK